ncbi:MAG: fibronectin type III domain-containing protein [Candidatus Acidiferrales bacterium]
MKNLLGGLCGVALILLAVPLAGAAQTTGEIIPGRYLVTFQQNVASPDAVAQELSRKHKFRLRQVYRRGVRGMAIEVTGKGQERLLSNLRGDSRVRSIGNDRTLGAFAQAIPKGITRVNAEPGVGPNTGLGVRVAIVDTGLAFSHADLAANIDTALSVTCINGGGSCSPGGADDNNHGTFVGGIVAAVNNSLDVVGVGPQITLLAVKVLDANGSGSFTDIIAAMDYLTGLNQAGTRVDVVNMSLGATCSTCTDNSTDATVVAFHDAVRALVNSGTTVVVASGNDGQNALTTIPASFDEVITVSAMADSDGQPGGFGPPICVLPWGAFCLEEAEDDSYASFANFGSDVDVTAPGVEESSLARTGGTSSGSGTSFASPHAAGVAALFIRDQMARGLGAPAPGAVQTAMIQTGECHEGAGSIFAGTAGCSQVWPGDPDGIAEPLVRADNVINAGPPPVSDDVAVTSLSVRSPVARNSAESVAVGVANQGTQEETFTVSLSDSLAATISAPQTVTLTAGTSTTLSFNWTPSINGSHLLTASASTVPGESDTADNSQSTTVAVIDPTHDVAVTSVSAPASVMQGNTANIAVTVANQGTFDETLTVSAAAAPPTGGTAGTPSGPQSITLTSGSSTTLNFTWNTAGATIGVHTLTASAALSGDDDPGDNSATTTSSVIEPPPAAPSNLAGSAISASQINLSWSDNSTNEQGFRLERCKGSQSICDTYPANFAQIAELGPNVTSYSDTGLLSSTPYSYRVRAFNASGNSAYSNTDEAITPSAPKPPAAPSNLTATAVSSTQINLTWQDNSTTEAGFNIERCTGTTAFCDANPANFAYVTSRGVNNISYSDTGRAPNTTYSYRVRASNADGYSAYTNTAEATTFPLTDPPQPPTNLVATGVSGSQINLSWTDNSTTEDGIRIERCTGTGCTNFAQIAQLGANATTYNNTGLAPATTYAYRVRAYNAVGDSAYSNTAEAATKSLIPVAPSNLAAAAVSATQINLTWQDNSTNESGFNIERCTGTAAFCDANPASFAYVTSRGVNNTSYSDTGRTPNTTYSYRVRASNPDGYSAYTNTAEATTFALSDPPTAPTGLTATTASSSQINLKWTDNATTEDGFRIERCLGAGCTNFVQIAQLAANATVYNSTGLAAATTYAYRVRAYNAIGNSAYSNTAEATTKPSIPAAPSNLAAAAVSSSQINLTWTDNSNNEDGFKIERCLGATCQNFAQIAQIGPNATAYSDTSLSAGTAYRYRVRAFNAGGNSPYSNMVSATTP